MGDWILHLVVGGLGGPTRGVEEGGGLHPFIVALTVSNRSEPSLRHPVLFEFLWHLRSKSRYRECGAARDTLSQGDIRKRG